MIANKQIEKDRFSEFMYAHFFAGICTSFAALAILYGASLYVIYAISLGTGALLEIYDRDLKRERNPIATHEQQFEWRQADVRAEKAVSKIPVRVGRTIPFGGAAYVLLLISAFCMCRAILTPISDGITLVR